MAKKKKTKEKIRTVYVKPTDEQVNGNSFDRSMDRFGLVVSAIRIGDKVNRLTSLIAKHDEGEVKDESLADTFINLACYAVMTLMWMHEKGLTTDYAD